MLDLASYLLRREGYAVELADGGHAGLRRLREAPPHLVVTDLHMPETSGWDVARAAGTLRPAVPVILTTGDADAVHSNPEGCALVEAILLKPFGANDLLELVRRLIGNGAAAASPTARDAVRPAISAAMLSGASVC
jgi:CheY-like chemotaxis protein